MDFSLTSGQEQLKAMIDKLCAQEFSQHVRELEEREEFPAENFRKLAEQGVMGILLPPPFGGAGADLA